MKQRFYFTFAVTATPPFHFRFLADFNGPLNEENILKAHEEAAATIRSYSPEKSHIRASNLAIVFMLEVEPNEPEDSQ